MARPIANIIGATQPIQDVSPVGDYWFYPTRWTAGAFLITMRAVWTVGAFLSVCSYISLRLTMASLRSCSWWGPLAPLASQHAGTEVGSLPMEIYLQAETSSWVWHFNKAHICIWGHIPARTQRRRNHVKSDKMAGSGYGGWRGFPPCPTSSRMMHMRGMAHIASLLHVHSSRAELSGAYERACPCNTIAASNDSQKNTIAEWIHTHMIMIRYLHTSPSRFMIFMIWITWSIWEWVYVNFSIPSTLLSFQRGTLDLFPYR